MEVYNNVEGNTVTEELVIVNTHLNKLKKNNFTVSYAKPYSNSYHSLFLNPDTSTYFYEIYDIPTDTQVLKLDLGTEDNSKYTIQQLLDEINSKRTPVVDAYLSSNLTGADTYQFVRTSTTRSSVLKNNIIDIINSLELRYQEATGQTLPNVFATGGLDTRIIAARYLPK